MTKRFGFTLAEVLITLGIIGVVAAMTIPTLISNTNGAQFKTAYKKALSTLNQAVLMNIAMDDTDFSTLVADTTTEQTPSGRKMADILTARMQSATEITNTYTFPTVGENIEVTVTCDQAAINAANQPNAPESPCKNVTLGSGESSKEATGTLNFKPDATNYRIFTFADGTSFGFNKKAKNCSSDGAADCIGFIDVNGSAGPNTIIDCSSADAPDAEITECSSEKITDIFPVIFHGQTVEPASASARAVLFGK